MNLLLAFSLYVNEHLFQILCNLLTGIIPWPLLEVILEDITDSWGYLEQIRGWK